MTLSYVLRVVSLLLLSSSIAWAQVAPEGPTPQQKQAAESRFAALRSSTTAPDNPNPGSTRVEWSDQGNSNLGGALFRTAGTGIVANLEAISEAFPFFDPVAWASPHVPGTDYEQGVMWAGMNHEKMHACCSPNHWPGPGVTGTDSCGHLGIDHQNAIDICARAIQPGTSTLMLYGLCAFLKRDRDHWADHKAEAVRCINAVPPPGPSGPSDPPRDPCSCTYPGSPPATTGCYPCATSLPTPPSPQPADWNPIPACEACDICCSGN
jgi:hypothetical protein